MSAQQDSQNLSRIIDDMHDAGDGDTVTVDDMVKAFSHRGFGTLLLIPALITFLPTGGIPGVPIVCAIIIFFLSVQILFGRKEPWLPGTLRRASVNKEKLERLVDKAKPVTKRIDLVIKPRFTRIITPLTIRIAAAVSLVIGLSFVPLGPIPFAAALPSGALVFLALGLVAKDGLAMLLGFAASLVLLITGPVLIL